MTNLTDAARKQARFHQARRHNFFLSKQLTQQKILSSRFHSKTIKNSNKLPKIAKRLKIFKGNFSIGTVAARHF